MKKIRISIAALMCAGAGLLFSSCIGSFSLTKSVMNWNQGVGSKFVNELVFFAFWILPVYEVTALADMLVLNSIEFWGGDNPVSAFNKVIDTDHGTYLVACDDSGYTITHQKTGRETRLEYIKESDTWAVMEDGKAYPFMTFLDENHVKMITPEGDFRVVELSEAGVMAYSAVIENNCNVLMASK